MARARVPATLVAVLAVAAMAATAAAAAAGGGNSTISSCDTAKCGKGSCSEVPGPIPNLYKCTCDPGWSQPKLLNVTVLPTAPCIIPNSCAVVSCGQGGHCEKGPGASYKCLCQPGFQNLLNITSMPCIGACTFGPDCATLGLVNTPAAPAPAPVAYDLY